MSNFHGGFFVRSLDPQLAEPVRRALAAGLRACDVDTRKLHVSFAAIRDCPVIHVAIRNHLVDPRDEAAFHREHLVLGADVARAAATDVWAYYCDAQAGRETLQHFGADGSAGAPVACAWLDLASGLVIDLAHDQPRHGLGESDIVPDPRPRGLGEPGINHALDARPRGLGESAVGDPASDTNPAAEPNPARPSDPAIQRDPTLADPATIDRIRDAAPLGQLAAALGVPRHRLERDLALTPSRLDIGFAVPGSCTDSVTTHFSGALRPLIVISPADRRLAPTDVEESLYFPGWLGEELVALAHRLHVNVGTLAWAAWEAAKVQLYRMTPLFDDFPPEGSLPPAARVRAAPPSKPPSNLVLPADAPLLDRPADARDKVMLTMMIPARMRAELNSFAIGCDKPLSWILQQAILLVRHRLHAATSR
ncbi:MAG: hypothetical protein H0T89_25630 [Deltaproteobacteria bacterium]|nr:hypothetical protein [Deltaproteobacteria bacterium]MDQ3299233.1 hypothetical protein [Myxococcota bacterium]